MIVGNIRAIGGAKASLSGNALRYTGDERRNHRLSGATRRGASPWHLLRREKMRQPQPRGFTLIELMVTLAVLAIILAIAVPAFTDQVRKSRRSEAISTLQAWQLSLEQWRANNASYADTTPANANYPALPGGNAFYTYTLGGPPSPTGFTLTATPQGSQANDRVGSTVCNPMVLSMNAGNVTRTPAQCWR